MITPAASVTLAANAFASNDAYTLDRSLYPQVDELSAVAWSFRDAPRVAHARGLRAAVAACRRALPEHRFWLLVGHSAPQPDTAVARYRRLWSSLERDGRLTIPAGIRTEEHGVRDGAGVRWFGGIELDDDEASLSARVLHDEPATTLVLISAAIAEEVDTVLRTGWESCWGRPPVELVRWLVGHEALTLRLVGAFDDVEGGVVAFGPPPLTSRIATEPAS